MRKVTCESCKEPIEVREDLVAALIVFILKPFHESCYSRRMKTYSALFIRGIPINSILWTLNAFIGAPIGIGLILFGVEELATWFGVMLLLPAFYRLLAYFL